MAVWTSVVGTIRQAPAGGAQQAACPEAHAFGVLGFCSLPLPVIPMGAPAWDVWVWRAQSQGGPFIISSSHGLLREGRPRKATVSLANFPTASPQYLVLSTAFLRQADP